MAAAHPDSDQLAGLGLLPPQAAFTLPRPDPGDVLRDRYRGCLLAGAAGDALGRPAEGVSRAVLEERYPTGLREFQPWPGWQNGPRGTFTDDTQLSIVMAEWIADAGAGQPCASDAAARILAWASIGRGIGRATREALHRLSLGEAWWRAGTRSAGNGAAMRAAPFALRYAGQPDLLRLQVALGSVPTHRDVTAVASAIVQAVAVNECLVTSWPLDAEAFLGRLIESVADLELPAMAHRARGVRRTLSERIEEVGVLMEADAETVFDHFYNGAFVLETMPVALWCLLRLGGDPEHALVTAVMGGRDADTIAAILGNLLGALHGTTALPQRWIGDDLEDRDRLVALADRLYELRWS